MPDTQMPVRDRITFALLWVWSATLLAGGLVFTDTASVRMILIIAALCAAGVTTLAFWRRSAFAGVLGSLVVTGCAAIAVGLVFLMSGLMIALGVLVLGVLVLVVAGAAFAVVSQFVSIANALKNANNNDVSTALLEKIYEHSMLSDNAKRIIFRDQELALLREAIQQHIGDDDYNAGLMLCDELANLYGQRAEAEQYRTRILQSRRDHYETEIRHALEHFEVLLGHRDWAAAHHEAARLKRLYPDSPAVQDVDRHILRAREEHKADLESQFLAAADRGDVPAAMDLLKDLDRYMTKEEAARLSTTANEVVARHREDLTTAFKIAVNDHQWSRAAALGNEIISEFPNTKMANEVRTMIDVLQTRASQSAAANA